MSGNKVFFKLTRVGLVISFIVIASFFLFTSADRAFQEDSEDLAVGPMYARITGMDIDTEGYGLGRLTSETYPEDFVYKLVRSEDAPYADGYEYSAYKSQIGLQGIIYQITAGLLHGFMDFRYIYWGMKLCCTLFFVIVTF